MLIIFSVYNVTFFVTKRKKVVSLQRKSKNNHQSNHNTMTTQEIYDELVNQIADNASVCHGNGYCTWIISGRYTDSDGDRHEVKATTHDEELATGWHEDKYSQSLYAEYQHKWAEFLVDELELVNAY